MQRLEEAKQIVKCVLGEQNEEVIEVSSVHLEFIDKTKIRVNIEAILHRQTKPSDTRDQVW